jgi:hypothetical protein
MRNKNQNILFWKTIAKQYVILWLKRCDLPVRRIWHEVNRSSQLNSLRTVVQKPDSDDFYESF